MADLDAELGARLARLAGSVPVAPWPGHVEPAPVAARQRIPMAWVIPMVAIATVALASALLDFSIGPAPRAPESPSPGAPSSLPNELVHASATNGRFLLEIESPRRMYLEGEPIDVRARLSYLGDGRMLDIRISHTSRGPLKFGMVEPVNGLELRPFARLSCKETVITAGRSIEGPFEKSGGFDQTDPRAAEWRAFFAEPQLFLPAGTWHPYVEASFAVGDGCDGSDTVSLRAEIEIQVADAPPENARTTVNGDFELTIRSPRATWLAGEPIEIEGLLRYTGPEPSIAISHGVGANGGPLAFGIVEPIPIGGGIELDATYATLFALPCVGGQPCATPPSCSTTNLPSGGARADGFQKPPLVDGQGTQPLSQADIVARLDFLNDPELRLPAGTWRLYVIADFAIGTGTRCSGQRMRAEIEIEVVDAAESLAPASTASADGAVGTDAEGPYTLQIGADRRVYRASDAIGIVAALTYSGAEPRTVASFSGPAFEIVEPVYGMDLQTVPFRDLVCPASEQLPPGHRIEHAFLKSADVATIDPDYEAKRAYLQDPVLRLPPGTWHVRATAGVQESCASEGIGLSAEIEIVVLPDESGGSDQLPDVDLPWIASDRTFVLELGTPSGTYVQDELIPAGASYWFVGPERAITVGYVDPEIAFTVTQLDVDGQIIRDMVYEPVCMERSLAAGVPRALSPWRYYVARITAETWPDVAAEALEKGRLQLPPGRWRVSASLTTSTGSCDAPGSQRTLVAEAELTILPDVGAAPSTAGAFNLAIETDRTHYRAGEPIDPIITLENLTHEDAPFVLASSPLVEVWLEEIGGSRGIPPRAIDGSCAAFGSFELGEPWQYPLSQGHAATAWWPDPARSAYLRNSTIVLPAGTWRLHVRTVLFDEDCSLATATVLNAETTVIVTAQ